MKWIYSTGEAKEWILRIAIKLIRLINNESNAADNNSAQNVSTIEVDKQ